MSDPQGRLAFPLETLCCRGLDDLAARLAERVEEHAASGVVLGFPRHLDGRPGDLAPEIDRLAALLRARGLRVVLWDERLTSWEATQRLREAGGSRRRPKEAIDAAAATILLQSYLDGLKEG